MLIQCGAEIHDGATIKDQPLGKALQHGNIKTFECLIREGARVNDEVLRFIAEQYSSGFAPIAESMLRLAMSRMLQLDRAVAQGRTVRDILQHIKGVDDLINRIDRLKDNQPA
jgi:hypothetical protein